MLNWLRTRLRKLYTEGPPLDIKPIGGECQDVPEAPPPAPLDGWTVERLLQMAVKESYPHLREQDGWSWLVSGCYEMKALRDYGTVFAWVALVDEGGGRILVYDRGHWVQAGPWQQHIPLLLKRLETEIQAYRETKWQRARELAQQALQEHQNSEVSK